MESDLPWRKSTDAEPGTRFSISRTVVVELPNPPRSAAPPSARPAPRPAAATSPVARGRTRSRQRGPTPGRYIGPLFSSGWRALTLRCVSVKPALRWSAHVYVKRALEAEPEGPVTVTATVPVSLAGGLVAVN